MCSAPHHGIVWCTLLPPCRPEVYPGLEPYGQYSHVEPVVGILSDKPLSDGQWYDDDVVVHYTDADEHTYYRTMKSLPDDTDLQGSCAHPTYRGWLGGNEGGRARPQGPGGGNQGGDNHGGGKHVGAHLRCGRGPARRARMLCIRRVLLEEERQG